MEYKKIRIDNKIILIPEIITIEMIKNDFTKLVKNATIEEADISKKPKFIFSVQNNKLSLRQLKEKEANKPLEEQIATYKKDFDKVINRANQLKHLQEKIVEDIEPKKEAVSIVRAKSEAANIKLYIPRLNSLFDARLTTDDDLMKYAKTGDELVKAELAKYNNNYITQSFETNQSMQMTMIRLGMVELALLDTHFCGTLFETLLGKAIESNNMILFKRLMTAHLGAVFVK